jgi:uncharacterized protein
MSKEWLSPNTITGNAATGIHYLRRDHINERFWEEVKKGNHILFVAPRRVGKTSIMKDMAENCPDGFICLYEDIEGLTTRKGFYKRLFQLILQCVDKSALKTAKDFIKTCWKKYKIKSLTMNGVEFETQEIDYEAELKNLLPDLQQAKINTVIFLDEFAEVINNLHTSGHTQDAIDILYTLRSIRHDANFKHFTIVYAGSIGLHFVIKTIDRPKLINDLHPIETGALTVQEASRLIAQLTEGATLQLSPDAIGYLLKKVHHLLPYFIQLMLEEMDIIARKNNNPAITEANIDAAFDEVLKKNKNFDDWLERLKKYQPAHFPFINELLKHAAHKGTLTVQKVFDKANDKRFNRTEDYMQFVNQLLQEGYLVEGPKQVYHFISPFLQQYWKQQYPVYHD